MRPSLSTSSDDVRHEPRRVGRQQPVALADPEPGGLDVDGPDPEHRPRAAAVVAEVRVRLHDEALLAVVLVGPGFDDLAVEHDDRVRALAGEQRLADERPQARGLLAL